MNPYTIITRLIFSLALATWACQGTFAHGAEIRVLSTTGVHSVMVEMVPAFKRATEHKVSIDCDTANLLLSRIKGGSRPTIDELIKLGKIDSGGGKDLARSGVGVAVFRAKGMEP